MSGDQNNVNSSTKMGSLSILTITVVDMLIRADTNLIWQRYKRYRRHQKEAGDQCVEAIVDVTGCTMAENIHK